jgi:hypothetical protein
MRDKNKYFPETVKPEFKTLSTFYEENPQVVGRIILR